MNFGIPIVTAKTIYPTLAEMGVRPWAYVEPPTSLDHYQKQGLTEAELLELKQFAPPISVLHLRQPNDEPYTAFVVKEKSWATVFAFLPGNYLVVIGEFKAGADCITLTPPSGVPTAKENMLSTTPRIVMQACIMREFSEETGWQLDDLRPLTDHPLPVSGRKSTANVHLFTGMVNLASLENRRPKPDSSEHLGVVAIHRSEWLKVVAYGEGVECCAAAGTAILLAKYSNH